VPLAAFVLIAVMAVVAPVAAAGTFGPYSFSLTDGSATIDGYSGAGGSIAIPSAIEGYPVVGVASSAFSGSTQLTGVSFPAGVKSIAASAFQGCSSLASLKIPDTVTSIDNLAFADCTGLKHLVLPSKLEVLGTGVFSGCTGLTSVDVPQGTDSSGVISTFEGCTGLQHVNIGKGVADLGGRIFAGCTSLISVTMPASLASIGTDAFSGCGRFTVFGDDGSYAREFAVDNDAPFTPFGDYVYTIGDDGLTITEYRGNGPDLRIPATLGAYPVTNLGEGAFYEHPELRSVAVPSGVRRIAVTAWRYLTPNSMDILTLGSFVECPNLSQITVETDNAFYSSEDGVLFTKDRTTVVLCPQGKAGSYSVPSSVSAIGPSAFDGCSHLTHVAIPSGATTIGDYAFAHCDGLSTVVIPKGVRTIGFNAFESCWHLKTVSIPEHVADIGNEAFFNCPALADVYFLGDAPHIGVRVFANVSEDGILVHYRSDRSGFTNPWHGYETTTSSEAAPRPVKHSGNAATLIIVAVLVVLAAAGGAIVVLRGRRTANDAAAVDGPTSEPDGEASAVGDAHPGPLSVSGGFCSICSSRVKAGSSFCTTCGARITS
jgi:hypothetical protein